MSSPSSDDLDADGIFEALMARVGEAAPEPRLGPTREALGELGNPHLQFPFIHVTGTNGKTSTSRMAATLLQHHGLNVGLFTSPHLVTFAERIALNGVPASRAVLGTAWRRVAPVLAIVDDRLGVAGQSTLTFFEALTVLAYEVFGEARVDAAVIEVGIGGEWDSTNVADGRVAVFTPVSLDHTRQLGSTIEQIARTKSGIIKPGCTVIVSPQSPGASDEILQKAASVGANVWRADYDFSARSTARTAVGQLVEIGRPDGSTVSDVALTLHGIHQASNAATAVAAVDAFLGPSQMPASEVRSALSAATSPGRLQVVSRDPLMILDAAHNPAGAASLAEALREWEGIDSACFVIGILEEKDAVGIVKSLAPVATSFDVTQPESTRAIAHGSLVTIVRAAAPSVPAYDHESLTAAISSARRTALKSPRTAVVVTGSITLIGAVLADQCLR